jgi:hypothetical protein
MEERDQLLQNKLDRIIELHQEEIALMKLITADRCTCKKHRDKNKEKKEKKRNKDKS